ncbi:MAG: Uma2 family endonuclease [Gemmataceae bacterium]
MSPATIAPPAAPAVPSRRTMADVLHELGDIPAHRVRMHPYPGTATEADAVRATKSGRACELINGTLVEKPMGVPQGYFGSLVAFFLNSYVLPRRLGFVIQPDALFRMLPGNLREPDVSFTQKSRLPNPLPQVGGWCPDLCVEVLSPDNTAAEMKQKRIEYFRSGCGMVWEFDVEARTVTVYSEAELGTVRTVAEMLDGGSVLPGFTLPLTEFFEAFDDGLRQ